MSNAPLNSVEFKLQERLKELKCLYELSSIAWEAGNNIADILQKTLGILPSAMQHPTLAEARITADDQVYATANFQLTRQRISSPLIIDQKKRGTLEVGYRAVKKAQATHTFLTEEKKLIKAVARELSLIIKRTAVEEEKHNLQQQLRYSERLAFVGELSAGIAHELNEPLGRILGFAQLIKKEGSLNEQQNEDIERILKASLYAREVIKKLMIFSRQLPSQITAVNLNDIVENILYFMDVRYQSRKIRIQRKLDRHLPNIEADAVQLSQVLVNLITNAIHAMPGGGALLIETGKKGNQVTLTVKDTGHGMTPEIRKKIFEPFFTTKPPGQGTGLGLSVVHGIVVAHHGAITVRSTPGKGTRFDITLPGRGKKGVRSKN